MFSPQQITQFKRICSSFGIGLSDGMVDKFKVYTGLLLEWNQRMHLVSKGDAKPDRILRHFVDSLCILKAIDIPKGAKLLDLGSGAGFPGIPIKIVRDDIQLTLVESIRKKNLFLRKLSESLRLEGINIVNQRAEELADHPDFREKFDLVTAKAVGKLKDIVGLSVPFLKTGGLLVVYKGKELKKEIEETTSLKEFRIRDVTRIKVPEMDLLRWVVVVKRER
ncbi:MAG: 16S rRNA (guanine(527)-N(7))-methyltransferase RsmG [Candidatus Zixiibacteriota bacterium]